MHEYPTFPTPAPQPFGTPTFDWKNVAVDAFGNAIGNSIVDSMSNRLPAELKNGTQAEKDAYRFLTKNGQTQSQALAAIQNESISGLLSDRQQLNDYVGASYGGRSWEQLSQSEQADALHNSGAFRQGTVSIGQVNSDGTTQPLIPETSNELDTQPDSVRSRLGRGVSGALIVGGEALNRTIEVIGESNFKAAVLATQFALGGIPKTLVNLVLGETVGKWTSEALAPVESAVSEFIGTYGFDAHNTEELGAVRPASDVTANIAVGFTGGLLVGGGIKALLTGVGKFREAKALATIERDALRIREQEIRMGLDAEAASPTSGVSMDKYRRQQQMDVNRRAGANFEVDVGDYIRQSLPKGSVRRLSIRPLDANGKLGPRVQVDYAGFDENGMVRLFDAKASVNAPFTKNQTPGYPKLSKYGGVVVGNAGGTLFPKGTIIGPTSVTRLDPSNFP